MSPLEHVELVAARRSVPRLAMTESEAARFLGMSLYAFRRHVRPTCRTIRVGGSRPTIVAVDDLRDWFDRHAIRQEHRS